MVDLASAMAAESNRDYSDGDILASLFANAFIDD
jgi:hypothetical protein